MEIIKAEQAVYTSGKLPAYKVTSGAFNKSAVKKLSERTKQTLIDKDDYYDRHEKLVHSNGIYMSGTWNITESATNADNQKYTGMFAKDSSSLFIGRLSVALSETKQGEPQAFSMAGKIFGTNDIHKVVTTENFFVGDVLSGIKRDSVFFAPMTTKPQVKFRLAVIPMVFKVGSLFSDADSNAGIRPVTGIARMGSENLPISKKPVAPKYMMIQPIKPLNHTLTEGIDFRDEFAISEVEKSSNVARYFSVHVSDIANKGNDVGWQYVGYIKADETKVSYGCDRQLHFAHPKSDS